jgi:hypothetical protein
LEISFAQRWGRPLVRRVQDGAHQAVRAVDHFASAPYLKYKPGAAAMAQTGDVTMFANYFVLRLLLLGGVFATTAPVLNNAFFNHVA